MQELEIIIRQKIESLFEERKDCLEGQFSTEIIARIDTLHWVLEKMRDPKPEVDGVPHEELPC